MHFFPKLCYFCHGYYNIHAFVYFCVGSFNIHSWSCRWLKCSLRDCGLIVVPYGSSHLLKVLEQGVRAGLPVLVEVRTTLPPESCSAASPWQLLSLHTTSDESSRAWDGIGVQLLTLHVYILQVLLGMCRFSTCPPCTSWYITALIPS